MTIEDVKKELRRYEHDCKLIGDFEQEVEFYNTKILTCTAQLSGMPRGSSVVRDKIAEYIAKLEDLKCEKYSRLIELENRKEIVEKTIAQLNQPFKRLLHITYIQEWERQDDDGSMRYEIGHTLTETSYLMGYVYKYTCKLHGIALNEYLKVREKL